MEQFKGTGAALVTPMQANGAIDYQGLERVLQHTGEHLDFWVVMGTTGECATLSKEENQQVLGFVQAHNPHKLPIMYGLGGNNTQAVLEEIQSTDFKGVEAVLSVGPYYNKPSQAGIQAHFEAIAEASPVPVLLYNVPGRTGKNISPKTTLALAQHPNIFGIKEASGDMYQCMQIVQGKPEDFVVLSGEDMLTQALIAMGAEGVISVLANAYPKAFAESVELARKGDFQAGSKVFFPFLALNEHLYAEGNPVGIKVCLEEMGLCSADVRLPNQRASADLHSTIKAHMPTYQAKPKLKPSDTFQFEF